MNIYTFIQTVGLSLFITLFADNLAYLIKRKSSQRPLYTLVGILTALIFSFIQQFIKLNMGVLLTFFGYLFLLSNTISYIRLHFSWKTIFYLFLFVMFGFWISANVWGLGFHHPLLEENLNAGITYIDGLFHASISQMIKTYGVPSTGLNGVPYLHYHWGTHWLIAQLSNLLNISMLGFYQFAYPVIFIPLFFHSLLLFINQLRLFCGIKSNYDTKFWLLLIISFIGFFPIAIMGVLDKVIFFSESYQISLTATFIFFSLILTLSQYSFLFYLVPIFMIITGLLKISTMHLLFGLFVYLFLRLNLYRKCRFLFTALVSTVIYLILIKVTLSIYNQSSHFSIFHFIRYNVQAPWKPFFFWFNYFWTFAYIYLKLKGEKIDTFSKLIVSYKKRETLDIEILIVISILGFIPENLWAIAGGSGIFFADFQKWIAISLLLASKYINLNLFTNKFKIVVFSIFLLPLLFSFYQINFRVPILNFLHYNKINSSLNKIKHNEAKNIINMLQNISSMPISEKRQTYIYIPKTNRDFWKAFPCMDAPFIVPAITGIAMIQGLPEKNCRISGYGYEEYFPLNTEAITCSNLLKSAIKQILIIPNSSMKNIKIVSCTKQKNFVLNLNSI